MNISILYHSHYFQRELFLLQIDNTFTKVYVGSGLNGGPKGRVLPFTRLQDTLPRFGEAREGVVPGYIFKEFFYRGFIKTHKKDLNNFPDQIQLFATYLQEFLNNSNSIPLTRFETDDDFNNILIHAKKINNDMNEALRNKSLRQFDWFSLCS